MIIVYTGNGKGKTTAAVGLAVRAVGHCQKVHFIQFIKSKPSGEISSLATLGIPAVQYGTGFTSSADYEESKRVAQLGLKFTESLILEHSADLIILDEINHLVKARLATIDDLLRLTKLESAAHLVFTGRDAPDELIEVADLVTVFQEVKHPFHNGTPAQAGLEF